MLDGLRAMARGVKKELAYYRRVIKDPRTPRSARWLLGLAVGYAVFPIDLIPDFIPVIGYLDDVLLVAILVILAMKMVPPEVIEDCRREPKSRRN